MLPVVAQRRGVALRDLPAGTATVGSTGLTLISWT